MVRLDKVPSIVYNSCQGNPAGLSTMRIRLGHRTGGRNRQPSPIVRRCGKCHPARFQEVVAEMQRPFALCMAQKAPAGPSERRWKHGGKFTHRQRESPQTRAVAVWGLCHAAILLRATESCSRSAAPGGCCTVKGFGMLPNKFLQGKRALYRQRHCLQGFVRTKALLASAKPPERAHGLWNKV